MAFCEHLLWCTAAFYAPFLTLVTSAFSWAMLVKLCRSLNIVMIFLRQSKVASFFEYLKLRSSALYCSSPTVQDLSTSINISFSFIKSTIAYWHKHLYVGISSLNLFSGEGRTLSTHLLRHTNGVNLKYSSKSALINDEDWLHQLPGHSAYLPFKNVKPTTDFHLLCKSTDWFLYGRDLRHEIVISQKQFTRNQISVLSSNAY